MNEVRLLVAPCGCIAAADISDELPGFCRTNEEAAEDLRLGFRERFGTIEEARTVLECTHQPQWGVAS